MDEYDVSYLVIHDHIIRVRRSQWSGAPVLLFTICDAMFFLDNVDDIVQ